MALSLRSLLITAAIAATCSQAVADETPERGPYALDLFTTPIAGFGKGAVGATHSFSPLTYPDRKACQTAGIQWKVEVSYAVKDVVGDYICVPQVADLKTRMDALPSLYKNK